MEYLSRIVSHGGVKVDPKKIKSIKEWKVPTTINHFLGFLRLIGHYHPFFKNFGRIATPITTLLKKYALS